MCGNIKAAKDVLGSFTNLSKDIKGAIIMALHAYHDYPDLIPRDVLYAFPHLEDIERAARAKHKKDNRSEIVMIYLASPYSHKDPAVRERRFQAVCEHAFKMMSDNIHVFSPIAHTHPIAKYGLPKGWDFWEGFDRWFIKRCNELHVFMLSGWEESSGVTAEIKIAEELKKPIVYIEPE